MAGSASNLLGLLPAGQLQGPLLPTQLPGTVLTNGASGVVLNGRFIGDATGLTNLNLAANGGPFVAQNYGIAQGVNLQSGTGPFTFITVSNAHPGSLTAGIQESLNAFATNVGQLVTFAGNPKVNNYTEWGGGRLVLGPGIYYCGAGIQIPDAQPYGLTIEGSQFGNTVILLTNMISTPLIYDNSYPSGAPPSGWGQHTFYTWKNVTFATTVNLNNRLVWVGDDGYSKFEDCTFGTWCILTNGGYWPSALNNFPPATILCQGGTAGNNIDVWDHCNFFGGAVGLYCVSDHVRIRDCNFFYCGAYAPITGAGSYVISNGYPASSIFSVGCGLMIDSEFGDSVVTGCHFLLDATGIVDLSGGGYTRVSDTLFEGDNPYDVATMGGSYRVLISHCHWIWHSTPHSFTGVINSGANGYYVSAGNTGVSIIDDGEFASGDFSQSLYQNITPHFSSGAMFMSGPSTDPTSSWPKVASKPGECAVVSSNGSAYVLVSSPGSAAWISTNKIAGP